MAIRSSATPLLSLLDIGPQPPPGPHCSIQPSQDEHGFCPSDCGSASTQAMSGCSPSPFRLGNGALIASVGIFAPEVMGQRLWRREWNRKAESSPLFCFALFSTTSDWVLDGTRTMRTLEETYGVSGHSEEPGNVVPSGTVPRGASKQLSSSYMSQQILWLLLTPTT